MIEVKFDPTSPEDRAAVRDLLNRYEDHGVINQPANYELFVKSRGRNVAVKPYILDFLKTVNDCDDLDIEVQAASDRVMVSRYRGNVAVVYPSGRVMFRAPDTGVLLDPIQVPSQSDRRNDWTAQLYLTDNRTVKIAREFIDAIREKSEELERSS